MQIVSVANRKGGIGKTTFSVNISRELVRMGYLVLMVDLDSQCDLTRIFRPASNPKGDIMKLMEGNCELEEAVSEVRDNLYIIPGSENLVYLRAEDIQNPLSEVLENPYLEYFDFVIMDHPPHLNEGALQGYYASNQVLVVIEPEALCVCNIRQFMGDLLHIQETGNPDLHVLGLAFNRIDRRRNLTGRMIEKVERLFGPNVFDARVSNNTAIPISLDQRKPVRDLEWWADTNIQFRDLTEEMIERVSQ